MAVPFQMVMQDPMPYEPVRGKTYSLFGMSGSTSEYYQLISELSEIVSAKRHDAQAVIQELQEFSKKKRTLKRIAAEAENASFISLVVHLLNERLAGYTLDVDQHLRELPLRKYRDRRLRTTREQYHLYMLEIELANHVNRERFLRSDKKIALLPYCLKDLDATCKSVKNDFDYTCRSCSKHCYENHITRLLRKHEIEAFIWMGAGLKEYAGKLAGGHQTLGILGIACVPELAAGIRKCRKYNIPAIGLPLDANRCIRWMGRFHKNSVNLEQLEQLVANHGSRKGFS